MTTERIDIVISENGSRTVVRNLDDIANSANRAGFATLDLSNALSKQEKQTLASALGAQKLSKAYADTARANSFAAQAANKQAISLNQLVREQEKTSTSIVMNSNKVRESAETTAAKIATANQRLLDTTAQGAARTNAIVTNSIARNDAINAKSVAAQQFNAAKIVNLQATSSAKVDSIRTASIARNDAIMALSAAKQAESQARIQLTAARTAEVQERSALRAQKAIKETGKSYFSFENVMKTTTIAAVANEVRKAADEYTTMQNRLKALGVAQSELATTTDRLAQISNRSYSSLEGTTTLYARLLPAVRDLGASQNELFTFTQAASQAMTIFGTSGGTATGALLQLSQAMSRGKVQAQEFKSLQDGMYPLLQVVAKNMDGLGGSVAKLRQKMLDGELTSKKFFEAAIKGAPELEQAMLRIAPTTSQALTVMRNQFVLTVGRINEALGITREFAKITIFVADRLPQLAGAVAALTLAFISYRGAAMLTAVANTSLGASFLGLQAVIVQRVIPAVAAFTKAIFANPLGVLVALIAGAVSYLYMFRNEIALGTDKVTTMGDYFEALGTIAKNTFGGIAIGTEKLSTIWDNLRMPSFADFLKTLARGIDTAANLFKALGVTIGTMFGALPDLIGGTFDRILNKLKSLINGARLSIATLINDSMAALRLKGRMDAKPIPLAPIKPQGTPDGFMGSIKEAVAGAMNSGGIGASSFVDNSFAMAEAIGKQRLAQEAKDAAEAKKLKDEQDKKLAGGGEQPDKATMTKAAREQAAYEKQLESLRDKYDSVYKAQSAFTEGVALLDKAEAKGDLQAGEYEMRLRQMHQELDDARNPIGAINRELKEQSKLLAMSSDEQDVYNQVKKITNDLIKKDISQQKIDSQNYEDKIKQIQKETEVSRIRNQILDETLRKEQLLANTRLAIKDLEEGGPKKQLAAEKNFQEQHKNLLFSQAEIDRMALAEQRDRVEASRVDTIKGEAMYAKAMAKIKQQEHMITLNQYSDFFGTVATMMSSHSKKAFQIGKAAAIAQAVIQTYMGATAAFASLASTGPWGVVAGAVAAAAAIAAGMANVAQIRAQQMPAFAHGGSMMVGGTGGTDSQVVSLRATPGEVIRVTTPQQEGRLSSEGGGGATYNFNMPGITNATQARKSRSQIQRSVVTTVSTGKRFK